MRVRFALWRWRWALTVWLQLTSDAGKSGGFTQTRTVQGGSVITVVCDVLTSRLVLEDRAHPEVRKPTTFSVVQVKLKDPEIHDSVAWEPPGGRPGTSVAFAATFENLWRMGKMTKGWKKGKNLLSTLVLKREERDRWQTVSQLARNFCRSTEQIP